MRAGGGVGWTMRIDGPGQMSNFATLCSTVLRANGVFQQFGFWGRGQPLNVSSGHGTSPY